MWWSEPRGSRRRHGGLAEARGRGLELRGATSSPDAHGAARVIDFSVNLDPRAPAPEVLEAARTADLAHYPDPTAEPVRRALAEVRGGERERYVVGAGAAELMWTLARALAVEPGLESGRAGSRAGRARLALVAEPTFSEFGAAWSASGGELRTWRARESDDFRIEPAELAAAAHREHADAVYLCNPNNPTGGLLGPEAVRALADAIQPCLLVLDEAFLTLGEGAQAERAALPANTVRLRSWTKDHALAGLRIGWLECDPGLAASLEAARAPWTVSAPAQAAALAILAEPAPAAEERRRALLADRDALAGQLREFLSAPLSSAAPFLLWSLPRPWTGASLAERLARRGVLVRDCSSFGLPNHVRLAARPAADREVLLAALAAELT